MSATHSCLRLFIFTQASHFFCLLVTSLGTRVNDFYKKRSKQNITRLQCFRARSFTPPRSNRVKTSKSVNDRTQHEHRDPPSWVFSPLACDLETLHFHNESVTEFHARLSAVDSSAQLPPLRRTKIISIRSPKRFRSSDTSNLKTVRKLPYLIEL